MKVISVYFHGMHTFEERIARYREARHKLADAVESFSKNYNFIADEERWENALLKHGADPQSVSTVLNQRVQAMVDLAWRRTDLLRKIERYESERRYLHYTFTQALTALERRDLRDLSDEEHNSVRNNIIISATEFEIKAPDYSQAKALATSFGKYEKLIWEAVRSSFERLAKTVKRLEDRWPYAPCPRKINPEKLGAAHPYDASTAPAYGAPSAIYAESLPEGLVELPRSLVGLIFKSGDYSSYIPTQSLAKVLDQLTKLVAETESTVCAFKKEKGRLNEKNFRERLSYLKDIYAQTDRAAEITALTGRQNQLRLDFESSRLAVSDLVRLLRWEHESAVTHLQSSVGALRRVLSQYCSDSDFAASQPSPVKLEVTQLMLLFLAADHRIRLIGNRIPGLYCQIEDELTDGEARLVFQSRLRQITERYQLRFTGPDAADLTAIDQEQARYK
ncbi:MAG TPA: hypothetical protein V6C81_11730 [Planktothrix sp.]